MRSVEFANITQPALYGGVERFDRLEPMDSAVRDPKSSRPRPEYRRLRNSSFGSAVREGEKRWVAYPHPQAIFPYYDGLTGDLLYAEPILSSRCEKAPLACICPPGWQRVWALRA
jgi:hypothetical protein